MDLTDAAEVLKGKMEENIREEQHVIAVNNLTINRTEESTNKG